MRDAMPLALALLAGVALGALFFGGLWWTVRRSLRLRQPAPWILGSALLRTLIALAAFYWIAQGGALALGVGVLGFVAARQVATRLVSPSRAGVRSPPRSRDVGA